MATTYSYTISTDVTSGVVNVYALTTEIQLSDIVTALDSITMVADDLDIIFKATLSAGDETILDGLVLNHSGLQLPDSPKLVTLSSPSSDDDGFPIMLPTNKPLNHYTCVIGGQDGTYIGKGTQCLFKLAATDSSKNTEFSFDEAVFFTGCFVSVKNAPFGATLDIDIMHPTSGDTVGTFARNVPLLGTQSFLLNAESRNSIPSGIKLKFIVENSSGTGDEDAAAEFFVACRFDTYRPNWDGVNL